MKCTLSLMNNFVFIFMVIYNIKYGVNLKFPCHIHYYNQGLLKSQSLSFPIYSVGLYLTLSFSTIYLSMNSMDFIEIKRIERVEKKYYLNHIHLRNGVMWRQKKKSLEFATIMNLIIAILLKWYKKNALKFMQKEKSREQKVYVNFWEICTYRKGKNDSII